MKRISYFMLIAVAVVSYRCANDDGLTTSGEVLSQTNLDLAQTSAQLASGTTLTIIGSSSDSTAGDRHHGGHKGHGKHGILDGLNLLAPTDELLAIVEAESAGDLRGMRISRSGGGTITHYNEAGDVVTLPLPDAGGPQGCSFSGNQFPEYDSLLETIIKTEIDFGTGTTFTRDTISITRAGKILIERSTEGSTHREVTTFENYIVNGIKIEGTKTRTSTYDEATGSGTSKTSVDNGRLTFSDGTVAIWTSEKTRTTNIALDSTTGQPSNGTITTEINTLLITTEGETIFATNTTTPLVEDLACKNNRRGPESGIVATSYRDNNIEINFGDASCTNQEVTITVNGITTTKTIG